MKSVIAMAAGAASLPAASSALGQYGSMMNDGGWAMGWMGQYGGWWTPLVVVVLIVAVVALVVRRKGK